MKNKLLIVGIIASLFLFVIIQSLFEHRIQSIVPDNLERHYNLPTKPPRWMCNNCYLYEMEMRDFYGD